MTTKPGPTETRVRAALLRLWKQAEKRPLVPGDPVGAEHRRSWRSSDVRTAMREVGCAPHVSIEAVQRVGLRVASGKGVHPEATSEAGPCWSELDDGLAYTYDRGKFSVRTREPRRVQGAKPDPSLTKAFADIKALDEQTAGHAAIIHGDRQATAPLDENGRPKVAWVEIHGALMFCPCGHTTDFTDHVRRVFCSRAEATCEGCGTRWGTPSAADCERLDNEGFPEPTEPRVTQRQLDLMRHATGGKLRAVRNYSISPPGHEWRDDWTELVRMGLAGEGEPPDCSEAGQRKGTVYHVTEAGFRMAYGDVRKPKRGSKR